VSKRFVITMTAANRVGILAATTNAIADLGGDIVEIRQTLLQGFFTMIIAVDFPESRTAQIVREHVRAACDRYGVALTIKDPEAETVHENAEETESYVLELFGPEEPGVVRTLSVHLARLGIDITDLHTRRSRKRNHFRGAMQIAVPVSTDFETLRDEMRELAARTGLEIALGADTSPGDSGVGLAVPALSGEMPVITPDDLDGDEPNGKPR